MNNLDKKTIRTEEDKRTLTIRINKLIGQLNGIKNMIEEDRYCGDVLIQLSAVDKACKSLASLILDKHIHTCVIDAISNGDNEIADEIVEMFRRFQ